MTECDMICSADKELVNLGIALFKQHATYKQTETLFFDIKQKDWPDDRKNKLIVKIANEMWDILTKDGNGYNGHAVDAIYETWRKLND